MYVQLNWHIIIENTLYYVTIITLTASYGNVTFSVPMSCEYLVGIVEYI